MSDDSMDTERRYRLDARVAHLEGELAALKASIDAMRRDYERHYEVDERHHGREQELWEGIKTDLMTMDKRTLDAIHTIDMRLHRQQSFIGGVLFIVGGLWAALGMFKDRLFHP